MTKDGAEENGLEASTLVFWSSAFIALVLFLIALLLFEVAALLLLGPDWTISTIVVSAIEATVSGGSQQSASVNPLDLLISAAGTFGSLAVSLALTAVYLSQNDIMQEQVETQTEQLESMRQEKVPLLGVHEKGLQLHDGKPKTESSSDSEFTITEHENGFWASIGVENHGGETAQQVHLACLVYFPDCPNNPPLVSGECAMESARTVTDSPVGNGALITPEPGLELLRGEPKLALPTTHGAGRTTFQGKIAEQLVDEKNRVRFGFVLIYTNSMEQVFCRPLSGFSANPRSFDSFNKSDITAETLTSQSGDYKVTRLIDDLNWTVPSDVFDSHDQVT